MLLWALVCAITTAPAAAEDLEANRQALRRAIQLFEKSEDNWNRVYYLRRREVREYDGDGKLKTKRSFTHRREPLQEVDVLRLIARDDQPLPPAEAARQEEKLKSSVAAERSKQGSQLKSNPRRAVEEEVQLMREFPEALEFHLAGTERIQDRKTNIYEFSPRPGYIPKSFKFRVFEKLKGKCWIEPVSGEMVQVDAEIFDNVSVGFGVLGKINKGTRFHMTRIEASPGVWMPSSQEIHFQVRVMLVKNLRQEMDIRFSEYTLKSAKVAASH